MHTGGVCLDGGLEYEDMHELTAAVIKTCPVIVYMSALVVLESRR